MIISEFSDLATCYADLNSPVRPGAATYFHVCQMTATRRRHMSKWKKAIALACALYFLIVWITPLSVLPFVNILPFIHERDFSERLIVSSVGTFVVLAALVVIAPQETWKIAKSQESKGTPTKQLVHWAGVIGGLTMFTCAAAGFSANTLGLAVKILPSHPYRETVVLESVDFGGSKYRSATLRFKRGPDSKTYSVVLSKRLFDYSLIEAGNVLEFRGEQVILGVYVHSFSRKG